jgi:hypothetical protein
VEIFLDLVVKNHSDLVVAALAALVAVVATRAAAAEGAAVAKTDLGSDVAVTETVIKNSH